ASTLLFVVAGALVGALAGYGGGRVSVTGSTAQPDMGALTLQSMVRPTGRGEVSEELAMALVELSTTLDVLRKTLEQTPSASSRTPAGEALSLDNTTDIASSLRVLANALQRPSAGAHSYAAEARLEVPTWVDRQGALNMDALRQLARKGDWVSLEKEIAQRRSAHLFKGKQEILTSYGKPDQIESEDGLIYWGYKYEDIDYEDHWEEIRIGFEGDYVVGFDYDY
ncbi:MAG TPA: hypothetical protein QF730_10815, partial [Planctomycetota bacterium]|nr:hypothetical protein [Planctomycetota bacterium]